MPEDMSEILYRSAENLRLASDELNAMMHSLWNMLAERKVDLGEIEDIGDEGEIETDWVVTAYAFNAKVLGGPKEDGPQKRGRKKQIGTVTLLVRLCGSGEIEAGAPDWPWLKRACLIVGWHTGDNRGDWWGVENFEPSSGADYIRNNGGRVWTWFEEDEAYASFFVVPVSALKDDGDLKRHVLEPLKKLFEGGASEDAFPKDSPVLGVDAA